MSAVPSEVVDVAIGEINTLADAIQKFLEDRYPARSVFNRTLCIAGLATALQIFAGGNHVLMHEARLKAETLARAVKES